MDTAIKIEDLSVSYGTNDAVSNINLKVKKGEFLGITGQNGGGKTTILNAILGLVKASRGKIEILGKPARINRRFVGFVPQNAEVDRNFPISVKETVLTSFLKSGFHPFKSFTEDEFEITRKVLKLVGLERLSERQISQLSGGEFQRLLIARALACSPEILILDEATSNIDAQSRKEIYCLLSRLNNRGVTIIMVTHELENISDIFSRIVTINQTITFDGTPSDFLKKSGEIDA